MVKIFLAQEFCYVDWHSEGCKNVGVEEFVNVRGISRFCERDLLWKLRFV